MIKSQWNTILFWMGTILIIILATVFYRPAAARTGSLLIWMRNNIYVMDIDSLILEQVGPANPEEAMAPAPGCSGQTQTTCWTTAGQIVYAVQQAIAHQPNATQTLPLGPGFNQVGPAVSWSPDGRHLAYTALGKDKAELRVYNAATSETFAVARSVDPTIEAAWSAGCAAGLQAAGCELAYKSGPNSAPESENSPQLAAFSPATGQQRRWEISPEPIFELRWDRNNNLLYSRPKRHFYYADSHAPAFVMPANSRLGNLSPDGRHTVFYQPFRLEGCPSPEEGGCLHLGVWLNSQSDGPGEPTLIYNLDLTESRSGGLNFVPIWSPQGDAFIFIQEGNLIHYDFERQEATIWYKSLQGKLRSLPVYSPNGEAVAFVDNQGQGISEYRLVVVNPRLDPIEHIIITERGFRLLAWLAN